MKFKPSRGFLLIPCLVALSSHALPADRKQQQGEAAQFLTRVRDTTNIGAPGSPPFLLRAHVGAVSMERGKPRLDGT